MSENSFTVDLGLLDDIVARLAALAGFLDDTFEEIDRQMKTLHGGSWDGIGAQAHAAAHRKWLGEAQEFAQGVTDAADAARRAHDRYHHAVQVNIRMVTG
ncbi:WXG100 family type VII secretion target [Nocardia sp. NPDC051321]|uniref:WXG100 family type VII secretion target n=1 Tax=Nocardia sp. NPDC051321 TaxID=3364323 RepID=UPI00378E5C23